MEDYVLVLGGSGTNLFAYVGVYRACIEVFGAPPSALVGTSGGALMASLIASGLTDPDELEAVALKFNPKSARLLKIKTFFEMPFNILRGYGLISYKVVYNILKQYLPKTMAEAKIPITIVTTNIDREEEVKFSSEEDPDMDFSLVTTASACFPFAFTTPIISGERYTDGGVCNNFAVDSFVDSTNVIGVIVDSDPTPEKATLFSYPLKIISSMMRSNDLERTEDAKDASIIRILGYGNNMKLLMDEEEVRELIDRGYRTSIKHLWRLKNAGLRSR